MARQRASHWALLMACVCVLQHVSRSAAWGQPSLSRSVDSAAGSNATDAPADKAAVIPGHARLAAYEQCGGEGGLCKTTTIGVVCGDHPWDAVNQPCPDAYACTRQTPSFWQCTPVLGRKDANNSGPATFKTGPPAGTAAAAAQRAPTANLSAVPAPSGTTLFGPSPTPDSATPEVKACKPGEFSVGSRCFKGSSNGTAASAGSASRPSGWQLAATLAGCTLILLL